MDLFVFIKSRKRLQKFSSNQMKTLGSISVWIFPLRSLIIDSINTLILLFLTADGNFLTSKTWRVMFRCSHPAG